MSKIIIRLSERVMRLWISQAERNLKAKGLKDTFKNIINEITELNHPWIIMGLSEQDIKDINKTYTKIQLERRMITNEF